MKSVGILSPAAELSGSDALECARLAEELGYSSLSEGESWGQDAFTRLSWLASATSRIRIGTSVVPVFGRSPANLAMTALSLDVTSEGRFFLGIGATGRLVVEALHGLRFERPVQRMREYIEVLRKAGRFDRLDYDGELIHMHHFQLRFAPQRKDLPIYIGCQGRRSLRLTGELADGWLPIFYAPGRMAALHADLAAGAAAAGRSVDAVAISAQVSIYVTEDRAAARDRERPTLAFFIGAQGPYFHDYMQRIGFGAEADGIRAAFAAGNFERSCSLVSDEMVDAVTLIGTARECKEQLERFFEDGVHEVRLQFHEADKASLFESMRQMAPGR